MLYGEEIKKHNFEPILEVHGKLMYIDAKGVADYIETIKPSEFSKDSSLLALLSLLKGEAYFFNGELNLAMSNLDTANILLGHSPDSLLKSSILMVIGFIYSSNLDSEMAIYMYKQALEVNNNKKRRITLYKNLCLEYSEIGHDSALYYIDLLEKTAIKDSSNVDLYSAYSYASRYYNTIGDFQKADSCFKKAFALPIKIDKYSILNHSFYVMNLIQMGRYEEAAEHMEVCDSFGYENMGIFNKMNHLKNRYQLDSVQGNYIGALRNFQQLTKVASDMTNKDHKSQLAEFTARYDLAQKEMKILALQKEKEIVRLEARNNRQLAILGGLAFLLSIITVFVFYSQYKTKSRAEKRLLELNRMLIETKNKLSESNEELNALAENLQVKNKKLDDISKNKDRFISIIAHDIKNPLNVILGMSQILDQSFETMDKEKRKVFVHDLYVSSVKLAKLIQDILDWSKTQMEGVVYKPENFKLKLVANTTIDYLASNAQNKNIQIEADITDGVEVFADHNMVFTIMRNLISNAIKFSYQGGRITIKAFRDKDIVRVEVTDQGVGMSDEQQQKLFQVGSQKSEYGTNSEKGTGLGLAICSEFVNLHQGNIGVRSEPEKGSTFWFTLQAAN